MRLRYRILWTTCHMPKIIYITTRLPKIYAYEKYESWRVCFMGTFTVAGIALQFVFFLNFCRHI